MDKINGLNQIVQILRSRISKSKEKTRAGKSTAKNEQRTSQSSKLSVEELESQIVSKLKQLDKNRPDYKDNAVDVFLDEVLCWEFGSQISSDSEFNKLKEKINNTFKENRALDTGFSKVLAKIG